MGRWQAMQDMPGMASGSGTGSSTGTASGGMGMGDMPGMADNGTTGGSMGGAGADSMSGPFGSVSRPAWVAMRGPRILLVNLWTYGLAR